MGDPPFDLSKFDPSSLNLSHLHPGEQNRIRKRQFTSQELSLLFSGQNPWTQSGKPKPLPSPPPHSEEPTLDDLRRICHADTLPLLERGDPGVRAALEAQWKAANSPAPDSSPEGRKETPSPEAEDNDQSLGGTPWPRQQRSATPKERADAEFRRFMPEQVRAESEKADADQRKVIWEANKRAFEAAKKRKEQNLLREQKLMEQVFDTLQRIKEDPGSHHLLPPADASLDDLKTWFEKMSQPTRNIPFAAPTEEYLRQDRITRAIQSGQRPDPKDLAEEEAEKVRYQREVSAAFNHKRKELEDEWRAVEIARQPTSEPSDQGSPKPLAPDPEAWGNPYLVEYSNKQKEQLKADGEADVLAHARAIDIANREKEGRERVASNLPEPPTQTSTTREVGLFLRKWAAVGGVFLLGACWTMIQIDEYALALILLVIGMGAFSIQVYDWKGIDNHSKATRFLKYVAAVLILASLGFFGVVIMKRRGSRPWSILLERKAIPPIPQPTPVAKTLHDYFREEGGNCWREIIPQEIKVKNESVKVEAQMCMDFNSKSQHLAFYISDTNYTAEVCERLLNDYQSTIREFVEKFQDKVEVGPPERRKTQVKDLRFTRFIVIFHATSIPQSRLDLLDAQVKRKGLIVEFHSQEYVLARLPK